MIVKNGILRRILKIITGLFVIFYYCTMILPVLNYIFTGMPIFNHYILDLPDNIIKEK